MSSWAAGLLENQKSRLQALAGSNRCSAVDGRSVDVVLGIGWVEVSLYESVGIEIEERYSEPVDIGVGKHWFVWEQAFDLREYVV